MAAALDTTSKAAQRAGLEDRQISSTLESALWTFPHDVRVDGYVLPALEAAGRR